MTIQAKQTAQQRLMLAPNITLALEVLRMPTLELVTFLEQQLEENPLLELDNADQEEDTAPPSQELNGTDGKEDAPGLDEDWLSHWRTIGERENGARDDGFEEAGGHQGVAAPQSLYESLRLQLGCQRLSDEERRLGELVIQHLDQHGYLEDSLEELAAQATVDIEQLAAALRVVQRFDPPGVGARDLRECLMLQLEHAGAQESLAYRILHDHFQLFLDHRLPTLAKATGADPAEVTNALEDIKRLNPKPGRIFAGDLPPSIVPDLVITKQDQHYDVELHDQNMPRISMSRAYYRMLKDPRTPTDAKEFLMGKFRQASWLIKAIDERNATILSIARCLISLQRDFLEQGQHALKPLTQAQVATLIGRHPSTVSRAITGKSIDTPYGIFYLEQFFASGVPQHATDDGGSISDERIKSELQRLIAEEDTHRPLSDATLAKKLAERNVSVARRTIAKYRANLRILPAHLRKRRL